MIRHQEWVTRLFTYIDTKIEVPFAWGTNDCITFMTGALEAMTGVNPAYDFPKYDSALSAARIIKEHGGLDTMVSQYFEEIPVLTAQRGDIVYYPDGDNGPTVGVVIGAMSCAPGETGLVQLPVSTATKAWRV